MNNQKMVNRLLQECKQMLEQPSQMVEDQPKETEGKHQLFSASLPEDLRTLIEEAKEMKWPFVPERWQYKQAIDLEDKTNLQDMINARLHELLIHLKTSIANRDYVTAAATVFLLDRFLYWIDGSNQLLQIVKRLHQLEPMIPIAPQLVIRQARISMNSGKLLKAEYILSSLIIDNGATGVWKYYKESDRILVQSVCIQIRGQILQKLGMWYEAAELIWASILGYFILPQPDKKGIATSLGILADIFISMSEDDYIKFKNNSQLGLVTIFAAENLLKEFDHRLLSAAEACKLAATLSQFTPLFVLTAVNIRGNCLLTYSCSSACPSEKQAFYLSQAKESFEIGLLSKMDTELVTSKQELHSFIKAAFCLVKVHQRLSGQSRSFNQVHQLCQEALEKLYAYSHSLHNEEQEKEQLAKDIMSLVMSVKEQLQVQNFPNSDAKSYIPDSYKTDVQKQVVKDDLSFEKVLRMYFQHHEAVCDVFETACKSHKSRPGKKKTGACITTLKTETRNMDTLCTTEANFQNENHSIAIPVSQKARKRQDDLKDQMGKKVPHAVTGNVSLDEESESKTSDNLNKAGEISVGSQSKNKIFSQLGAWSKLSSSSWEEIDNNKNDLLQDKVQKTKNTTDLSESAPKTFQENDLCLSNKTNKITLQSDTRSSKHPFQKNIAFTNRSKELDQHFRKTHTEAAEDVSEQSLRETMSANSQQNNVKSFSSQKDRFEIISSEKVSRTKDSSRATLSSTGKGSIEDNANCIGDSGPMSRNHWQMIDLEGETVDGTEDSLMNPDLPGEKTVAASLRNSAQKGECDNFVQNWINQSANMLLRGGSPEIAEVNPQIAEDWELVSDGRRELTDHHTNKGIIEDPQNYRPETPSCSSGWVNKPVVNHSSDCATTEEDEGEKLSSCHHSGSLKSWCKSSSFSSSFSELGSPSLTNSSGSSFSFISMVKEQMQQARILSSDDYDKLLAGVEHAWLMERMKNTGFFKPNLLHKTHYALLLKYSKISGLWTGQETAAYIGDYLSVAKKGKQRNAFWIHFLHQEETLGRYVGKEYKEEKEIVYHFSDVERQMTAQYYVTEFNKRLYEQKITTQIFYIPSVVLLILEGKTIQGCVTVEPYILGEFVKLSNNTNVVKLEYKATEYGLAYGHFCYEFSQGTDVVVDLQGWVTDNGKGLIYLTDPQIHSVSKKETSGLINFGKKGIYYFFNNQHTECNEICSRLSLTRPSIEKPM